jgi:hypothetical protein
VTSTPELGHVSQSQGSVNSVSGGLTDGDKGGAKAFVPYGPDAAGWVVEVWFCTPRRSGPERCLYWHGPPTCQTSNLNESVAVFPDADSARSSFQRGCLPLPVTVTKWEAVSVEEALTRYSPYPVNHGWSTGRLITRPG